MIPEGWQQHELGALLQDIKGGGTPSKKNPDFWHGEIPWASVKDITAQYRDRTEDFITATGLKDSASNLIPAGTVIIATRMAVGKAARFHCDVAINQDLKALFPKKELSNDYLFFWLNANESRLGALASGSTVQGIRLEPLRALEVALPPLSEQKRIAEVLGGVDAAIEATNAVILQTKKTKQGLLQTLLTRGIGHAKFKPSPLGQIPESWQHVKLSDHTKKIGSGVTPRGGQEVYKSEGFRLLRSQNVGWGKLLLEDVAHIDLEQHSKMSGSMVKCGDVLLNITGASIGRAAAYFGKDNAANVNQHVCIIRPDEALETNFLLAFIISPIGQRQIDLFQAGGNRQGLNFENVGSFTVPLPPLPEQKGIVAIFDGLDNQLAAETTKLASLQQLKKGLMQDLLTGKVRVS